jgi:hypothetical protein
MRKNYAVALAIAMSWAAAAAHADGECVGGAAIDSAGNECMRDVEPVVVRAASPALQLRPEVKTLSFAQTLPAAGERKKAVRLPAPGVAHPAAPEPAAEPNRCAGTSDATGNAC